VQAGHYPEPVAHCEVCHWWDRCNRRRRDDDHLAFIAHIGRGHRAELVAQGVPTLSAAAAMPVPIAFKPSRGSTEAYERLAHQARLQHAQRTRKDAALDLLPVQDDETAAREGPAGLRRLPAPSPGDIFLDLEGARFARDGEPREYLFGFVRGHKGTQKVPRVPKVPKVPRVRRPSEPSGRSMMPRRRRRSNR
jgi:predicted RecB family nuclease